MGLEYMTSIHQYIVIAFFLLLFIYLYTKYIIVNMYTNIIVYLIMVPFEPVIIEA